MVGMRPASLPRERDPAAELSLCSSSCFETPQGKQTEEEKELSGRRGGAACREGVCRGGRTAGVCPFRVPVRPPRPTARPLSRSSPGWRRNPCCAKGPAAAPVSASTAAFPPRPWRRLAARCLRADGVMPRPSVRVSLHIAPRCSRTSPCTGACASAVPRGAAGCPHSLSLCPVPRGA